MAGRLGIGIGLGMSAAALVAGGFNMEGRYTDEMASDRANAATAEAFLENQGAVKSDILALVADVDGEIGHFTEAVGAACMTIINDADTETIDDVIARSDCELDEGQVDKARDLLSVLQIKRSDLTFWTEPLSYGDGETGLDSVESSAREVIDDSADSSVTGDLIDTGSLPTISVEVRNGTIVTTEASGNKYDISPVLWFAFFALSGVLIVDASVDDKKKSKSSENTAS